jgi:hypothetical protein
VTHPLLGPQFTDMSLPQMQEAVKLGGAVEITANYPERRRRRENARDRSHQGTRDAERVRRQ